jgi:hypothetical protein
LVIVGDYPLWVIGGHFALATDAAAEQQQRTFYNLSRKFVGRSSTNSSGTKTRSVADLDLDQLGACNIYQVSRHNPQRIFWVKRAKSNDCDCR